MMRQFVRVILILSLGISVLTVVSPSSTVYAATDEYCVEAGDAPLGSFLSFPTWYKYLSPSFVDGECTLNFNFPEDIGKVGLALVEIALRIGGLVAVAFIIYAGFQYILSQGEVGPGNVPKSVTARHTVVNALIGLIMALLATVIVSLIAGAIT